MVSEMNLVPEGTTPKSSIIKLVADIKTFDIIGTIAFFLGVLVITALMVINSQELKVSNTRQEKLKSSIKSLQKTEQQYVLVKDRVDKIEKIINDRTVMIGLENFNTLKSGLPIDVVYGQIELNKNITVTSLTIPTYSSLAQTLANIISSGLYKEIILSSFVFSPKTGYSIAVKLSS